MTRPASRRSARAGRLWWEKLPDEKLLDVRLCDLDLSLERPPLAERVARLDHELERSGLVFRPTVWLSSSWFSPEGVPGFAIPFFVAHPRLARLERHVMLEVEGGRRDWCLKLMRHETGHAIDTAYRLHRRKSWRDHFGNASLPYRPSYVPRPGSRSHVENLDNWYAQSHPIEDFAETFAVWLRTRGRWRSSYRGSPALRKLEYVDGVMREIAGRKPLVHSREKTDSLPQLRTTLRQYFDRKRAFFGDEDDDRIYDRDLARLFTTAGDSRRRRAAGFLRECRGDLRRQVSRWTGQRPFLVDEVLAGIIRRCRARGLRLQLSERDTRVAAAILVTLHTARVVRMRQREYYR